MVGVSEMGHELDHCPWGESQTCRSFLGEMRAFFQENAGALFEETAVFSGVSSLLPNQKTPVVFSHSL